MSRRASLLLAALVFACFPAAASSAQSDPLDPANPALERIWIGGRLIAVDRLPAQVPSAFSFTDQSDVAASTLAASTTNGWSIRSAPTRRRTPSTTPIRRTSRSRH